MSQSQQRMPGKNFWFGIKRQSRRPRNHFLSTNFSAYIIPIKMVWGFLEEENKLRSKQQQLFPSIILCLLVRFFTHHEEDEGAEKYDPKMLVCIKRDFYSPSGKTSILALVVFGRYLSSADDSFYFIERGSTRKQIIPREGENDCRSLLNKFQFMAALTCGTAGIGSLAELAKNAFFVFTFKRGFFASQRTFKKK